jgi:hypothetical protein
MDSSLRRSSVANSSAKSAPTPRQVTRLVFQEITLVKKDGIKGKNLLANRIAAFSASSTGQRAIYLLESALL